jgi:biopolymer transport protein ExbD
MAPLIDVVFLLLIFFMCSMSFDTHERRLPAQLPRSGPAAEHEMADFDPVHILVSRRAGDLELRCDGQPCADFGELLQKLRARRAIAQVPVIIEGCRGVPFGHMVTAMDLCYQVDFRQVAFAATGAGR